MLFVGQQEGISPVTDLQLVKPKFRLYWLEYIWKNWLIKQGLIIVVVVIVALVAVVAAVVRFFVHCESLINLLGNLQ